MRYNDFALEMRIAGPYISRMLVLVALAVTLATPALSSPLGKSTQTIHFPDAATALAWSPNGTRLAAANQHDNRVYLYDLSRDRLLWTVTKAGNNLDGNTLAFDATGRFVITGSTINAWPHDVDKTLSIIAAGNGEVVRQLAADTPDAHARNNIPMDFSLSPDKNKIAVILGMQSGRIAIYDTFLWDLPQYVQAKAPTPGAKVTVSSSNHIVTILYVDGEVQVLDYSTNTVIRTFRTIAMPSAMAVNPITGLLVIGGSGAIMTKRVAPGDGAGAFETLSNDPSAPVSAWDPVTGSKVISYPGVGTGVRSRNSLSVSPNGKYVAAITGAGRSGGAHLLLWDASSGKLVGQVDYTTAVESIAFSADSRRLAVSLGSEVQLLPISD